MSTLPRNTAVLAICALCTAPAPGLAQDVGSLPIPFAEVSSGYVLMRDTSHERKDYPTGWYFSGALNPTQWFAIVGEVSGSYGLEEEWSTSAMTLLSKRQVYTLLAGPRFFGKVGRIVPFGQLLAGVAQERERYTLSHGVGAPVSSSRSKEDFAMQGGGGVTVLLSERVGLRMAGDYRLIVLGIGEEADYHTQFRFVTGFTLQWGGR
jgi:hypothetical protein